MAVTGPQIDAADAAIIINDADLAFGCMGCARTNELVIYLLRTKGMPVLDLIYPTTEEEGIAFVAAIRKFLGSLGGGTP
jgi:putative methanogenesis marker protein 5